MGRSHSNVFGLPAVAIVTLALTLGCGSNTPKIPPELLATGSCTSGSYPSGPFGTEEGDTLSDACFQGFRDPSRGSDGPLERVAFADYYDPNGVRGIRLILINTAAVWCSACRTEHEGLGARTDEYRERGLRIVSTLFQDARRNPASERDLRTWVDTFSSNYAMLLDADYQLGAFASAETAPLNLVVDARTMRIEKKLLGDQASVLWPLIDAALSEP
jgi:hypothetical protein